MLRYFAVISVAVVLGVDSQETCGIVDLTSCASGSDFNGIIIHDNKFPKADFLDKYCKPVIDSLGCVKSVVQRCPKMVEYTESAEVISSWIDLAHSICDEDSDLRKGYLKNVYCYDTVVLQHQDCETRAEQAIRDLAEVVKNTTAIEDLPGDMDIMCLLHDLAFSCAIRETEAECGVEETAPLKTILDQFSAIFKETCPPDTLRTWETLLLNYMFENQIEVKKK